MEELWSQVALDKIQLQYVKSQFVIAHIFADLYSRTE